MKFYYLIIAALLLCISTTSCKDENSDPQSKDYADEVTRIANDFVFQIMDYYYLYNEGISKNGVAVIDYNYEKDTKKYFKKLLNSKDIFSFITDDAEEFKESQNGNSSSMGWEYSFMYADNSHKYVVAAIDYVYPNTPADKAGAKRGDFIFKVNDKRLTPNNFQDLWNSNGKYEGSHFYADDTDLPIGYELTSENIHVSPVAETNVFTLSDGTKVGYLLYMDFYAEFNNELTDVFDRFKAAGVSRLILDLRYNSGGEMLACSHLASLIAPASAVANEDVIVRYKYNSNLSSENDDDSDVTKFKKSVIGNNLDLKDIVIIQGRNSYSASEATIIGLKPYMNVYTIGDVSGGKNTAMYVLTPDLFVNNKTKEPFFDERINNWLIAPLVAVYYNSKDETFDTTDGDGMEPDFSYNEYDDLNRHELGDENESLTALALKYIATGSLSQTKAASLDYRTNMVDITSYKKPKALQIPYTINK